MKKKIVSRYPWEYYVIFLPSKSFVLIFAVIFHAVHSSLDIYGIVYMKMQGQNNSIFSLDKSHAHFSSNLTVGMILRVHVSHLRFNCIIEIHSCFAAKSVVQLARKSDARFLVTISTIHIIYIPKLCRKCIDWLYSRHQSFLRLLLKFL